MNSQVHQFLRSKKKKRLISLDENFNCSLKVNYSLKSNLVYLFFYFLNKHRLRSINLLSNLRYQNFDLKIYKTPFFLAFEIKVN